MGQKIPNNQESLGWAVLDGRPIDDRSDFVTKQALIDFTNAKYTVLYDGLVTKVDETGYHYRWSEGVHGLFSLNSPFEYNSWDTNIGGIDYANKTYNWVIEDRVIWMDYQQNTTDTFIELPFADIPEHLWKNEAMTVEVYVDTDTEVTLPDSLTWGSVGRVRINFYPSIPIWTNMKIKLS